MPSVEGNVVAQALEAQRNRIAVYVYALPSARRPPALAAILTAAAGRTDILPLRAAYAAVAMVALLAGLRRPRLVRRLGLGVPDITSSSPAACST